MFCVEILMGENKKKESLYSCMIDDCLKVCYYAF